MNQQWFVLEKKPQGSPQTPALIRFVYSDISLGRTVDKEEFECCEKERVLSVSAACAGLNPSTKTYEMQRQLGSHFNLKCVPTIMTC